MFSAPGNTVQWSRNDNLSLKLPSTDRPFSFAGTNLALSTALQAEASSSAYPELLTTLTASALPLRPTLTSRITSPSSPLLRDERGYSGFISPDGCGFDFTLALRPPPAAVGWLTGEGGVWHFFTSGLTVRGSDAFRSSAFFISGMGEGDNSGNATLSGTTNASGTSGRLSTGGSSGNCGFGSGGATSWGSGGGGTSGAGTLISPGASSRSSFKDSSTEFTSRRGGSADGRRLATNDTIARTAAWRKIEMSTARVTGFPSAPTPGK